MKLKICLIHEIGAVLFFLSSLCHGYASPANPEAVKIAVITDIHFLDTCLVEEGEALSAYERATGRNIADLHAVLDAVLADLTNESPDLLLITGDITNHGEKQSHLGFLEKLKVLQSQGIRILVIPGNHDINIPDSRAYKGKRATSTESISKVEFAELYGAFGYSDALKRDESSLSYLAEINESVWLLCFDTNRYEEHMTKSITGGRLLPETMDWAIDILEEAKDKGIIVMGMMHHGLVEHLPYQATFFPQYLIDDWEKNADILADAGLKVVFTGHFHANDITMRTSSAGNVIYDVETASLAQYPFAYRLIELADSGLSINTRFVTSLPNNPDLAEIYRDKLETISRRIIKKRLEDLGIPMSQGAIESLTDMIVELSLNHVKGDEKMVPEMKKAIRSFAEQLESEIDVDSFSLDFPPEDNHVVIPLE